MIQTADSRASFEAALGFYTLKFMVVIVGSFVFLNLVRKMDKLATSYPGGTGKAGQTA